LNPRPSGYEPWAQPICPVCACRWQEVPVGRSPWSTCTSGPGASALVGCHRRQEVGGALTNPLTPAAATCGPEEAADRASRSLLGRRGIGFTSETPLAGARGASFGPRQSANHLNGVVLVRRAYGAAPPRRYGLHSVGRPTSARLSPERDPHRVAFRSATPRLRSWFSDRPAQQRVACRQAQGRGPYQRRDGPSVRSNATPQPPPTGAAVPPAGRPTSSTEPKGRSRSARTTSAAMCTPPCWRGACPTG
jgi:hypothetical protein